MAGKIKVLIVDDSAVVRQVLTDVLQSDPEISVIATASDPFVAADRIEREMPDVITLDVEMPRMDGITFLEKLMAQHPIPVVMCSSLTDAGCATAMRALELGAVAVLAKPQLGVKDYLKEAQITICDTVKAAARARPRRLPPVEKKLTADAVIAKSSRRSMVQTTDKVVVIGASTGGTEAVRCVLQGMPSDAPGIVVVQHMPEKFTRTFADSLNQYCRITVKEAEDQDSVTRGMALIAPGGRHILLKRSGARYYVEVRDGPLVSRHRPSADVLFRSASRYAGGNAVGVILTGMGDDGAKGMVEMKEAGATTIAQDEASCVVFGMPAEAIRLGGIDHVLALDDIAQKIVRLCS
ncbi:MAG: chemotaxis response regulator protein-glutamate methylesterase [Alphaproteobacteria bacterium]|nr:chemotaxis response regulator protein-glutamate methylesterase [Alphaproteobacteria bacterium]